MNIENEVPLAAGTDESPCVLENPTGAPRRLLLRPTGQFYEAIIVVWLTLSLSSVVLATVTWAKLSRELNVVLEGVSVHGDRAALETIPSGLAFERDAGLSARLTRASLTSLAAGVLGLVAGVFAFVLSRNAIKHEQRERELIAAKSEADRRSQEKTAFLANISHEIRTPMNAIIGFGEMLETDLLNEKQRGYLQSIRSNASSLLELVNDILDISQIEAGVLTLRPEPISPREICRFIETMFAGLAGRKRLHLSLTVSDDLPEALLLDVVRLRQILANLVGNAVKFTDEGGIEVHFGLENRSCGETGVFLISVKDTGIGIPADRLEAIFKPFVQAGAHPEKEKQGTGLGLAIVKRLVEAMGGSVTVTSEVGRGSLFQLRFPDVPTNGSQPSNKSIKGMTTNFNRLQTSSVLAVDDNETNRELLQAMFNGFHHRLLLASNGKQAIEIALSAKPDLILLDLHMPDMDGRKVLQMLRQIQTLDPPPIIALTASGPFADRKGSKTRFDGWLQKPFSKQNLFDEMARFLPQSRDEVAAEQLANVFHRAPQPLELLPTSGVMQTFTMEKDDEFNTLTHDLKSPLAGVIMSAELLLEQPGCINDESSRRLLLEILVSGRQFLAWVKDISARAELASRDRTHRNHMPTRSCESFRVKCEQMRGSAAELCGRIMHCAGGRPAQLAANIVRSCAELATLFDKFTGHRNVISMFRANYRDISEAPMRSSRHFRNRCHRKQLCLAAPAC